MDRSPQGIPTELPGTSSTTATITTEELLPDPPVLRLQLQKPKSNKKVAWRSGTIDNEDMGKKKSKCCCIYKKPTEFGESSSDSEDEECEHCFGHVEKRNSRNDHGDGNDCPDHGSGENSSQPSQDSSQSSRNNNNGNCNVTNTGQG